MAAIVVGGTLYCMKKTSIYLDPEIDRALGLLAEQSGTTKAEVIRRAIAQAVQAAKRPQVAAIGVGEGPGDVAGDIDRHLRETGFGKSS